MYHLITNQVMNFQNQGAADDLARVSQIRVALTVKTISMAGNLVTILHSVRVWVLQLASVVRVSGFS